MAKAAIFAALSLSVTATLLLTGSDACDGVPSMSAVAACQQASTGADWLLQFCRNILRSSPEAHEVTNYAVAAASATTATYESTREWAIKLLADASSSDGLKSACRTCIDKCDKARALVAGVVDRLRGCALTDILTDCTAAIAAIDDCSTAVLPVGGDTQFFDQVVFSRDRSALTLRLAIDAALLLTGSDARDGAPSMSAVAACQQASTRPLYQLCANTLGTSPEAQEVTSYVVAAANSAAKLYVATKEAAGKVVADPSEEEDMKSACRACLDKYNKAQALVAGVVDHLHGCSLTDIRTDCATAVAAVDDCATAVLPVGCHTPLYSLVLLGRDRSVLALRLAMLLVPNN